MDEILIDDEYKGKRVVITRDSISFDTQKIKFEDITDFDFSAFSNSINMLTTVDFFAFAIHSPYATLTFDAGSNFPAFASKNNREEKRRKVSRLFEIVYPHLLPNYLRNAVNRIKKIGSFKVAKITFTPKEIQMTQRAFGWMRTIYIPYGEAKITYEKPREIRLYMGGDGPMLKIHNTATNEYHVYSNKIIHQPSYGEAQKAIELLHHIKETLPFEVSRSNNKRL